MSITKMPGFTAERSIHTSPGFYWSSSQGEGTAVVRMQLSNIGGGTEPSEFGCFGSTECSECIPLGPSIFSPGRQFCTITDCRPTITGGCRCRVLFKGFRRCQPRVPNTTATLG